MKITKTLSLLCIALTLPACAMFNDRVDDAALLNAKYPADQITLLGFVEKGKPGEKQTVHDRDNNNAEGTAIIQKSYQAASGNHCRTYFWQPSGEQGKTDGRNLNVACQAATGQWYKVRTLSNIETFLEKEPVGYVLH